MPVTSKRAFTLVELLVIVGIISLLVTILMPSLARAKQLAREAMCLTRLGGQVRAIYLYAMDNRGRIPVGPANPLGSTYPYEGMPDVPCNTVATNRLWIGMLKTYDGCGALIKAQMPFEEGFFCPGDDSSDPVQELAKLRDRGGADAHGSYLYRQLDQTRSARWSDLGTNDEGWPAKALMMDMNCRMPGYMLRTNHGGKKVNVAYVDGHCSSHDNQLDPYTLREQDTPNPFTRLDEILKYADRHE
ncbi:MAG: hypothetical protein AMJ81_05425 [Phycisphaerae bacterium SM23_33]|jgi:prepilin-type processing-associated H-X9-DG protein|nr:MAG: hypothetical protein AMJ81_05425 [Phycisphaerae bacterium SM23_33]